MRFEGIEPDSANDSLSGSKVRNYHRILVALDEQKLLVYPVLGFSGLPPVRHTERHVIPCLHSPK